jgi:rSAM/selenodomain-associated transferase 1
MTGRCALIVFAKAPLPGFAKTRLATVLGPVHAARLAARLLEHAVDEAIAADIGPVELCCTPDTAHPAFARLAARHPIALATQDSGDLGARMRNAVERVQRRHAKVVLIGTDAPALDADYLRGAARALADHDVVLGPAADGGYTLVGLACAPGRLFDGMAWSTDRVLAQTRQRIAELGLRHRELQMLSDVDEPIDLAQVPEQWLRGLSDAWSGDR